MFHHPHESGTNWSGHTTGSLANEAQARHQEEGYQEVEGAPEHRLVRDGKNYSIRVDICAGCILELNRLNNDIIISTQLEDGTAELRSIIPIGASREGALQENFKRF